MYLLLFLNDKGFCYHFEFLCHFVVKWTCFLISVIISEDKACSSELCAVKSVSPLASTSSDITLFLFDGQEQKILAKNLVVSRTMRNFAGGQTAFFNHYHDI